MGPSGDGEPDHEVSGEVGGGSDGEDNPRWCDFVDEARDYADIAPKVFEEAKEVEGSLVIAEGGFDVARVYAEHVGGSGGRHYEGGSEKHEPPAGENLVGEVLHGFEIGGTSEVS